MINPICIQIAVVSHKFPNRAIKLVKIFPLKPLKTNLNTVLETIVFDICACIFIELVYCILVKNVNISCLNDFTIIKKDFEIGSLEVV